MIRTAFLILVTIAGCSVLESKDPEKKIRKAYKEHFGIQPEHIAFVYTEDWRHHTSTFYEGEILYRIFYEDNGAINSKTIQPSLPVGQKSVLLIVPVYDELPSPEDLESMIINQQERINKEHKEFAGSRGYEGPVVSFETTNLFIDLEEIDFSRASSLIDSLRLICSTNALIIEDFDHVVLLDMDVHIPFGGFADVKLGIAKVGWIYGNPVVNDENMAGIMNAVYHHEIGHLWGWEHAWSDPAIDHPFITEPKLFGWEDMNDNGVADILD